MTANWHERPGHWRKAHAGPPAGGSRIGLDRVEVFRAIHMKSWMGDMVPEEDSRVSVIKLISLS
jgi:hypothetical protein